MSVLVPLNAVLKMGAAGSQASTVVSTVADIGVKIKKNMTKIPSRLSAWALYKGALKDLSVEFSIADDPTDTNLATLIAAFTSNTPLSFWIQDATSGHGPDGDFDLASMDRDEKNDDGAIMYKFSIQPTPGRIIAWS